MAKLSKSKQEKALAVIAKYLGPKMGYVKPCGECEPCAAGLKWDWQCDNPDLNVSAQTGQRAAHSGLGPMLIPDWDWPSSGPAPSIILEGGPDEWAYDASNDESVQAEMAKIGIYCEPYSTYALCLYAA